MSYSLWNTKELAQIFGVDYTGPNVTGISIDSRTVKNGDMYVALKGHNHDGHRFVDAALKSGANAALVHEGEDAFNILKVQDTFDGIYTLAKAARHRMAGKVVGITGSYGKTTTKELTAHVLRQIGATHASQKSFNNHWGVPITLCQMPQFTKYGVLEMGMNHAGELTTLSALAQPNIALITEVGLVHKENFDSLSDIVEAKCEIFSGLTPGGTIILNRDSATYQHQLERANDAHPGEIITFGRHQHATVRLVHVTENLDHSIISITVGGRDLTYRLNYIGDHWVMNSLATLSICYALDVDLKQCAESLDSFKPLSGRGKTYTLPLATGGTYTILDESYNSNPDALKKALSVLVKMRRENGRLIAVLGEMGELGPTALQDHAQFAPILEKLGFDKVYTSGQNIQALFTELPDNMRGVYDEAVTPIAQAVVEDLQENDVILIKGSRGGGEFPRMQEVVDAFKNHNPKPDYVKESL